jgi:uncharacterized protein YoxC
MEKIEKEKTMQESTLQIEKLESDIGQLKLESSTLLQEKTNQLQEFEFLIQVSLYYFLL